MKIVHVIKSKEKQSLYLLFLKVTLMVAAVIVLISLLLWGIDSAFSALISFVAA